MKRFSNILYVFGTGPNEATAFKRAIELAKSNQSKLTIVSTFDNISKLKSSMPTADNLIDEIVQQRKQDIKKLISSSHISSQVDTEIKIFTNVAFIDIIQDVIKYKRDLLIKAIEPIEGLIETLFGSTDTKLLRKCPCPVWLIKAKKQDSYKKILVGLDYDPDIPENEEINLNILSLAGSLAKSELSELHIVHAWRLQNEALLRSSRVHNKKSEVDQMVKEEGLICKKWLETIVDKSISIIDPDASSNLKPHLHLVEGSAVKVVPELASSIGAELMVLGTIGRSGIVGYLVGNTAEIILNQINCSVLAIKPKGFISPIQLEKP